MDQLHNGAHEATQRHPSGRISLHKKRSLVRVRPDSLEKQPGPITTTTIHNDQSVSHDASYAPQAKVNGQRKGSLRNVVRKIFGRSRTSRLVTPAQQPSTPARHAYHRSEPHGIPSPHDSPDRDHEEASRGPQRALSTPLHIDIPNIQSNKIRSPYAVEFPKSAKLKPLEISSPFDAPGASLRRRKTLPSILIAGEDAVAIAAAAKKSEIPPMPARSSFENPRATPTSEIGLAISGAKESKRRSRSAGGMRTRDSGVASEPERKRSEEIRFWRESYQGSVLRASGFTVPFSVPPPDEQERDDKWQTTRDQPQEPLTPTRRMAGSPGGLHVNSHSRQDTLGTLDGSTQLNFRSTSGLSRDLEDRVAQLESSLQLFQRALNKMQADRNRRTVIVGDYATADQSKSYRTPSMLADDLYMPADCAIEDISQQDAANYRPATAPHPRSPIAEYLPVPHLPDQDDEYSRDSPPTATRPSTARNPSNLIITNPNVTFKSLYQMLSDERSARRKLETQMRTLHNDIQDLQQQVSSTSYSQRNSYMLSHEATMASSRLRELLRETESDGGSPEDTPRKNLYVSRFSGSTTGGVQEIDEISGAYDDGDEAQTPHEEYRTPQEEQTPFKFDHQDEEMF